MSRVGANVWNDRPQRRAPKHLEPTIRSPNPDPTRPSGPLICEADSEAINPDTPLEHDARHARHDDHRPIRRGGSRSRTRGAGAWARCSIVPQSAADERDRSVDSTRRRSLRDSRADARSAVGRCGCRHDRRCHRRQPAERRRRCSGARSPVGHPRIRGSRRRPGGLTLQPRPGGGIGRHGGLKPPSPKGGTGSTPVPGTVVEQGKRQTHGDPSTQENGESTTSRARIATTASPGMAVAALDRFCSESLQHVSPTVSPRFGATYEQLGVVAASSISQT
jgi:hypothetical protein